MMQTLVALQCLCKGSGVGGGGGGGPEGVLSVDGRATHGNDGIVMQNHQQPTSGVWPHAAIENMMYSTATSSH